VKKAILLGVILSLSLSPNLSFAAEEDGDDSGRVEKPRGGEDSGGGIKKSKSEQIKKPSNRWWQLQPEYNQSLHFLIISQKFQKSVNINDICILDSTASDVILLAFKDENSTYFTAGLNQGLLACLSPFDGDGLCNDEEREVEITRSNDKIDVNGAFVRKKTLDACEPLVEGL